MSEALRNLVETVALVDSLRAFEMLAVPFDGDRDTALEVLEGLLRQAPLRFSDRIRLLAEVSGGMPQSSTSEVLAAAEALRRCAPRFPDAGRTVELPPLSPGLAEAFKTLFVLDVQVPEPWTLIGGLMVMVHCIEHGAPFTRATEDADVAVGVFTHRRALAEVTKCLSRLEYEDVTPESLGDRQSRSYRWARGAAVFDVAVPLKVGEQRDPPRSVTKRPSVELPAIQQAVARSERITIRLADGTGGSIRRPDLLGAIVIKATAACSDNRAPDRHVADLVLLSDALATSGAYVTYREQVRSKDVRRIERAIAQVRPAQWRKARDPEGAQGALRYVVEPHG